MIQTGVWEVPCTAALSLSLFGPQDALKDLVTGHAVQGPRTAKRISFKWRSESSRWSENGKQEEHAKENVPVKETFCLIKT